MRRFVLASFVAIAIVGHASAGFMLNGPSFGFVPVNPPTPGGSPGAATMGTGLVSETNFVSWHQMGADSAPTASNVLSGIISSQGTSIAAIRLVSNATSPTALAPTTLAHPTNNMQRRTTGFSQSNDFSSNESVLYANASSAGIIIDFAVPVKSAGFRVQSDAFGSRDDFFLQGFVQAGGSYTAVTPLYNNLNVNSSIFSNSDSAQFYGIDGDTDSDTFTRLWIGFSGANGPFLIGTLEIDLPVTGPGNGGAVPVPPTIFAGLAACGAFVLRRRRL